MASTFKTFISDDIANTRTLLHEAIPITGSIVNKTTYTSDENIKTYGHGMFQSVYDYPYTSSSANHIFDMALGVHPDAGASISNPQYAKRSNIYNQMAQVLVGHDPNGEIRKFDKDGDLSGGDKFDRLMFFNFARLLGKDEIKKGTFSMQVGTEAAYATRLSSLATIADFDTASNYSAATDYKVNSPAGEYGILYATEAESANTLVTDDGTQKAGLIFYQAGVAVLTASLFTHSDITSDPDDSHLGKIDGSVVNVAGAGLLHADVNGTTAVDLNAASDNIVEMLVSSSIQNINEAMRSRIMNIEFNNTTELNSSIYFCRVNNNDFNYSANPTYLSSSKIVVKDVSTDEPVSYITSVGLYSSDNELLAVAKLSEPLKKTPSNEFTLRVRLDY